MNQNFQKQLLQTILVQAKFKQTNSKHVQQLNNIYSNLNPVIYNNWGKNLLVVAFLYYNHKYMICQRDSDAFNLEQTFFHISLSLHLNGSKKVVKEGNI